jgi:hypothetical protein
VGNIGKRLFLTVFILLAYILSFSFTLTLSGLEGSSVFIDGIFKKIIGKSVYNIDLSDTTHKLEVKKPGYTDYSLDISGTKGSKLEISALQVPLSILNIKTNSDSFYINYMFNNNNIRQKVINDTQTYIPSTIRELKIEQAGYLSQTVTVDLKPFYENKLSVTLKRTDFAYISSIPSDASIFVGSKNLGTTPYATALSLLEGKDVILKAPGYMDLSFKTDSKTNDYIFTMTKACTVFFSSEPSGALVTLNNEYLGITPFTAKIPMGSHLFTVSKALYTPKKLSANISETTPQISYTVSLEEDIRIFKLLNAENAEVFLDGINLGSGISFIVTDKKEHFLQIYSKNTLDLLGIKLDQKAPKIIDINKITVMNLYSSEKKSISFQNEISTVPAQFIANIISKKQTFQFESLTKKYNISAESGKNNVLIIDSPGYGFVNIINNVDDTLIYIDNQLIGYFGVFGYPLPIGRHAITVKYKNIEKTEKIDITDQEVKNLNFIFEDKIPIRPYSSGEYKIDGIIYPPSQFIVYVSKGPHVVETKGIKFVIYIDAAQSLFIDDLAVLK